MRIDEAEVAIFCIATGIALGLALVGSWVWAGAVVVGVPLGLWASDHQANN